jgi:hypothetical protein
MRNGFGRQSRSGACVSSTGNAAAAFAAILEAAAAMRPRSGAISHRAGQDSYNTVPFLESRAA